MRAFSPTDHGVEAAWREPSSDIVAQLGTQPDGWREQRVAKTREKRRQPIGAHAPRGPVERHRAKRVQGRGDGVIGQSDIDAAQARNRGYQRVQQRRVRIGKRNAAVPERHPGQIGKMIADVARQANEGPFDGRHLRDVIGMKEAQGYEGIDGE